MVTVASGPGLIIDVRVYSVTCQFAPLFDLGFGPLKRPDLGPKYKRLTNKIFL